MLRGFSLRLFPTKSQEEKMWQSANVARWVWNWGLKLNRDLYARGEGTLGHWGLRREFTTIRNCEKYSWLADVSRKVADHALMDLEQAYRNFFRGLKTGRKVGFPKIKTRDRTTPSFSIDAERIYDDGKGALFLLKIGHVKYKSSVPLADARILNPRIKFEAGKWLMTFAMETEARSTRLHKYGMGIDVGVKSLAVASCDGEKRTFKNVNRSYKIRRLEKQLKHQQRSLARKQKGSLGRWKEKMKVQRIYGKMKHIRHDYTHKVTTALVKMLPQKIVLENLNVQNMLKNKYLAKKVAEQGFHRFRQFMEYKAEERGIKVKFADASFASSKICSNCGSVRKDLSLSERIYKCPHCGVELDRDFNAARNLEKLAH